MQVTSYNYTHMHPTYVALNEVTLVHGCMVYTELCAEAAGVLLGISHAITKYRCHYHQFGGYVSDEIIK